MILSMLYSANDEDVLGPDGMEKFCEDIGVEPENVSSLCLQPLCIFFH